MANHVELEISWLKDCEICNAGLCKKVDYHKEKGSSIWAICKLMSNESNGLYSRKQIMDRYRYHTGKDKKISEIPKPKKTHPHPKTPKEQIFEDRFKKAFDQFYYEVQNAKMEKWEKTTKEAALYYVSLLTDLITIS
ncbi:hypothetical protein KA005_57445 [bacterium]|nr:hypothetical protein [bacterium]